MEQRVCLCLCCSFYDVVMEMIADRSSAVLDVESDAKLCSIKVFLSHTSRLTADLQITLPVIKYVDKPIITSRASRRRCEMYIGHARLCLSVRRRIPTLLHGPGCNLGEF